MGEKLVITVRFNPEGAEAELYRKIQQGKRCAGLSTPEYVKLVLSGYFAGVERENGDRIILQEIREAADRLEKVIKEELQEKEADLIRAVGRTGGSMPEPEDISVEEQKGARLPEMSGEIPQGALDFLDGF